MFTLYRIKGCFAREAFRYMCKHIGWAHNSRAFVFNMADKTQTDSQGKKKERTEFVWTDDEIELLLETVLAYKATCEYEGICWESVKAKYQKIMEIYVERYPTASEENTMDFPRASTPELLTKQRIAAKLKRIRGSYKKAVDSGRRSGGGRVVLTFFDLCERVWGGSPAVESIGNGIDSSALTEEDTQDDSTEKQNSISPVPSLTLSDNSFLDNGDESEISADISLLPGESDEEDAVEQQPNTSCSSKDRRAKIAKFLKDRKDAKMTKKLNCETQMLNCTKEDLGLKRKIAVSMEKSDTEMSQAMTKVNKTMESIGDSIKHGFALMAEIMKQTQAPSANFFPPQYPASFFPPQSQAPQATQNWIPSYSGQAAGQTPQQVPQPNRIPFANNEDEAPQL